MGGASRDSTGFGALEEGLILSYEGRPPKSGDLILIKETKNDIETTNSFCHIQVSKKETNPLVAQFIKKINFSY